MLLQNIFFDDEADVFVMTLAAFAQLVVDDDGRSSCIIHHFAVGSISPDPSWNFNPATRVIIFSVV